MFIQTAVIAILTISNPAGVPQNGWDTPTQSLPPCQRAPEGAPLEVIECFDLACKRYQEAWSQCDDFECRQAALLNYVADLLACAPHVQVAPGEWASVWYHNGEFGVSFDSHVPEGSVVFQF